MKIEDVLAELHRADVRVSRRDLIRLAALGGAAAAGLGEALGGAPAAEGATGKRGGVWRMAIPGNPTAYPITIPGKLVDILVNKTIFSTHNLGSLTHTPIVAQNVTITTPTFLQQNLRSENYDHMTDLQTAQSQTEMTQDQMLQRLAAALYTEMAEGF